MKKTSYSYVGVSFIILIFGIIVVPKIIDRIQNNDVTRSESRSKDVQMSVSDDAPLSYLVINGEAKRVMPFSFVNQDEKTISNDDYAGKVYLVLAVDPFVAWGLSWVVHANDLLVFSQTLEVPVSGGDPDGRAFAGGPLVNLEGSEGSPGGADDLEDDFPLPGRSLHSG